MSYYKSEFERMEVRTLKFEADATAASNDLQEVQSTIALNYHISPDRANIIYQQLGADYADNGPTCSVNTRNSWNSCNSRSRYRNFFDVKRADNNINKIITSEANHRRLQKAHYCNKVLSNLKRIKDILEQIKTIVQAFPANISNERFLNESSFRFNK
ncbi:MAG: hypothetical protein WA667_18760 [Candidatus Nitrosopolaris sp.]